MLQNSVHDLVLLSILVLFELKIPEMKFIMYVKVTGASGWLSGKVTAIQETQEIWVQSWVRDGLEEK